ncbi:ribosome-associated translation inhibitor RaiA [Methylocystis sp. H62]|jgi:ribosomal subunit interface protein|uniref:Ribosome hibernation promoting factor n=1 Tax=Methylocystis rosea TaxID=173366 RepID=A0A3G8M7T4_9HYPH|nr:MULTISPECIES: ribosome-associated translation inhibitor RaiA [Methylocystis]PPD18814.1 MAG: ribosomal subunit interface protein [Methylocystis sp.]PWB90005.1 ribosome-associated translation inhibitor RaiA [Methylocystis sp. MitZ-2018]AZG77827.1 ribosome-associated translation inhibitor RaiA [Methylocystis rosea]MBG0794911.1 ribosome-associated translation inhibitor RaiA [Methylocystis sp. H62]QGM94255.1 ribosome-associated translation inhibitor RaiA [Methylocystis rosea]
MSLRVSGKNINIGEALRAHVTQRLETAAAKYFDGRVSGHVTISPEGSGFRADCSLHLASGIVLQADGRAQEPYASFDQAAERIEKRLRRYKSRLKSHHEHGHGAGDGAQAEVVAYHVLEAPDQENEASAEFSPAIIAESTTQLRRLSVSAAVLDLDLTGAPVVVFRHANTGRVNVVYRRGDENIGWIDTPESEGDAR